MDYFKVMMFVLPLFFLTCAANAQQPDNAAPSKTTPRILTMKDSGKEIELGLGETIKVDLKFSGGTGYLWYMDGLDESHLKLIDEEVVDSSPENLERGPALGGPREDIRSFKTVASGDTSLRLLQYRVWEGKERAINKFEVKLHIDKQ